MGNYVSLLLMYIIFHFTNWASWCLSMLIMETFFVHFSLMSHILSLSIYLTHKQKKKNFYPWVGIASLCLLCWVLVVFGVWLVPFNFFILSQLRCCHLTVPWTILFFVRWIGAISQQYLTPNGQYQNFLRKKEKQVQPKTNHWKFQYECPTAALSDKNENQTTSEV